MDPQVYKTLRRVIKIKPCKCKFFKKPVLRTKVKYFCFFLYVYCDRFCV